MSKLISIIIPCYNGSEYIERCVLSVQTQDYLDWELILVDDGSTDETYKICSDIASKDSRIKVLTQKNGGPMLAWKNGVLHATGEYLMAMDCDDTINVDTISTLVKYLDDEPDAISFGYNQIYSESNWHTVEDRIESGIYTRKDIDEKILPQLFSDGRMMSRLISVSRWTKVYKKEHLLDILPLLDESLRVGEDMQVFFASICTCSLFLEIQKFYPYNYFQNSESAFVGNKNTLFEKFIILDSSLRELAKKIGYKYVDQLEADLLSNIMLAVKRTICRNKGMKRAELFELISQMRIHPRTVEVLNTCNIQKYTLPQKMYFWLFKNKMFNLLIVLTQMLTEIGVGHA